MSAAKKVTRDLVVIVHRDQLGQIFSEVIDKNQKVIGYSTEWYRGVVIDRAKGRSMDAKTVQTRAKSLADLIGAPLEIDLTWPCAADRKLPCHCPKCVAEGRV